MTIPTDFDAEIYDIAVQIPAGRVAAYGQLARLAGFPGQARRAGRALAKAPAGVPCHRIVNAAGRTAPGWSGQRALLEAEGVRFRPNGCADLAACGWDPLRDLNPNRPAAPPNYEL